MDIDASLEAGAQLAEGGQPSMSPFDNPSVSSKPVVAFDASSSDAVLDAAALEMRSATWVVIALVRMQFVWPAAGPSRPAGYRGQGIHCRSAVLSRELSARQSDFSILWKVSIFQRIAYQKKVLRQKVETQWRREGDSLPAPKKSLKINDPMPNPK